MIQSPFFWGTLLVSVVVFWRLPVTLRMGFLGLVSFGYLVTIDALSVLVLVGWTLAFFYLTPDVVHSRSWRRSTRAYLILGILGYLAYFKYFPQLLSELISDQQAGTLLIPLGISYYTFKLIHYGIEDARGTIKTRSLQQFACYMFLFPIFTAGPIERFDHFLANQEKHWHMQSMVEGCTRIIHGLIKQFVIAGTILIPIAGITVPTILSRLHDLSMYKIWGFLILSYLYAYISFSAYTDIAIGCSRLFGFTIAENFNWPIVAPNIGDFWQRWHMTLGAWCKAYIYLPTLGLMRNPYISIFATFFVIGLWHAGTLNFLFWGLYHGIGVAIYYTWARMKRRRGWKFFDAGLWRFTGIPLTFMFVASSFAFTATHQVAGLYDAFRLLGKLVFLDLPR